MIKCIAQGYNTVPLVRLKLATHRSQVKQSTTEPFSGSHFLANQGSKILCPFCLFEKNLHVVLVVGEIFNINTTHFSGQRNCGKTRLNGTKTYIDKL